MLAHIDAVLIELEAFSETHPQVRGTEGRLRRAPQQQGGA
jgi:hypothetical protein